MLYLLHGAGADQSQWVDVGATDAADSLIGSGAINPLIIVMPDGGAAMPDDLADGLATNLVPWTDHAYRTLTNRGSRAVGGISRGGRIALLSSAHHPGLFGVVGGHSPAVNGADATSDIVQALASTDLALTLDVGADDPLRGGVEDFASLLTSAGAPTAVTVSPGAHARPYWRQHASDYLRFYGTHLVVEVEALPDD